MTPPLFQSDSTRAASYTLSHLELPTAIHISSTKLKQGLQHPWAAIMIATASIHCGTGTTGNHRGKKKITITCCHDLEMGFFLFFQRETNQIVSLPSLWKSVPWMNGCTQNYAHWPHSLRSAIPSYNGVAGNDIISLLNVVTATSNIQGNKLSGKWPW